MRKNLHIILASFIFSILLWGSISLSNDYYATVSIPVKLVNFPVGYTSGSKIPRDISVKLKGEGWKLVSVNLGAKPEYNVSVKPDSGKQMVNLYNYLVENQWLSSDIEVIDISPDTLSFVVEKVISKKVKIVPNLDLSFKIGYGNATEAKIFPDSTMVFGPATKIKELKEIKTEKIKFTSLDEKKDISVSLMPATGISYADNNIQVHLNVQKIVEKDFSDLLVEVFDVPRDRNVVLLPNKVTVGIRGGIDILGRLDKEKLEAYLNYRDVVLDTLGSVKPIIKQPVNTTLLYVKPERLRYVIKKFN